MYKATWRLIRGWICHNHKIYYSYVILTAITVDLIFSNAIIGYYQAKNYERSLPFAIAREKEWQKNKPAEEDEYADDDEEGGEEGGE